MTKNPEKKIAVNSQISLKGLVKAIFNDTIHVQIGGKVITLPIADLNTNKLEKNM
ncbi:hypothetical protein [Robertmurraya andreesenii]|uniref:Uncharacterized protein n=1 Tax=Anoxybacillus andreesenii TaxID=1325932 RepID=A0ABT9V112_9BACL|nr:hypothetical protein [Robertmurraya andreesenii]MDQ0154577.1 hypothetical protein [Robertmurraya andreesenii]